MRVRFLAAVSALLGLMGAAVLVLDGNGDDGGVQLATRSADTTTSLELPTTTVDVTVPTTITLPPVTLTVPTVPRVRPSTTTTAKPVRAAKPQGGTRCGTPVGSFGLGAERTTTSGRLTVTLEVYSCELYDRESLQNLVRVSDKGSLLKSVRVDYGDGAEAGGGRKAWQCDDPQRPDPYNVNFDWHTYPTPGSYQVVATVTTVSCADGSEVTVTVPMTVYRIAGNRPA